MRDYKFTTSLEALWTNACQRYQDGKHSAAEMFNDADKKLIASIGATPQEIFDFAEDFIKYGEPDFTTFALVQEVRHAYFIKEQNGKRSTKVLDTASLPAKEAEVNGVVWLPRIIPKAKAKLRGELPAELMYGCGGDRRFFKENNIHPADFLTLIWAHENDDAGLIDIITNRRAQAA